MLKVQTKFALDRAEIKSSMSRAKNRALKRSGTYVKAVARNSIKIRKKRLTKEERDARVGQTPSSRTRHFKKSIEADYDPTSDSMLIGPTAGKSDPLPAAFEHGGLFEINVLTKEGWKRQAARYRKFPTMQPALKTSESKLAEFWDGVF